MLVDEFFSKVTQLPHVDLVERTHTVCVLRCGRDIEAREVRLGLWAIREFSWEKLAEGLGIPSAAI